MTMVAVAVRAGFDAWRELSYDKRFGFSTQTGKGFAADQAKNMLVVTAALFVLFLQPWPLIRAPPLCGAVVVGVGVRVVRGGGAGDGVGVGAPLRRRGFGAGSCGAAAVHVRVHAGGCSHQSGVELAVAGQ